MDTRYAIGNRIRDLREAVKTPDGKSMTQEAMAKTPGLGLSREALAKWETGERELKAENIIKLADFFGVTCDYILRGIDAANVYVHNELGLSNGAIEALKNINSYKAEPGKRQPIESLSILLEQAEKHRIVSALYMYFFDSIEFDYSKVENSFKANIPAGIDRNLAGDIVFSSFEERLLSVISDGLKRIRSGADKWVGLYTQVEEELAHFNDDLKEQEETSDGVHREE